MTPDPLTFYAWAARPIGPLSNLYMTSEQTETVYRWLSSVLGQAREQARSEALRDAVEAVKAVYTQQEGTYIGLCIHADAVAAIEALGGER